jgi:hypothetical protein
VTQTRVSLVVSPEVGWLAGERARRRIAHAWDGRCEVTLVVAPTRGAIKTHGALRRAVEQAVDVAERYASA